MTRQAMHVPPTTVDGRLAAALRRLRKERGVSQERFGALVGLTGNTIGQLELGKAGPSWITVVQIAESLGLTIAEFAKLVEAERSD